MKLTPEELWRVTKYIELLTVLDHRANKEKRLQLGRLLTVLNIIKNKEENKNDERSDRTHVISSSQVI